LSSVQSASDKIKAISAKFDLVEDVVSSEIQETLDAEVEVIVTNKQDYHPIDVMSLENMAADFKFSRETLKESIDSARLVMDKVSVGILENEENSVSADDILSFTQLSTAIFNGVKVHSQLYKDFSATLLSIKNINKTDTPTQTSHTTNNLTVNTEDISTIDVIARLKKI